MTGGVDKPVTESADPRDLADKFRNEDDAALRNYLSKPKGIDEGGAA